MTTLAPTLLHLIGVGLEKDAHAADGHHLRWSFEPRLGFPRTAFCLDRRPSLTDPRGREAVALRTAVFAPAKGDARGPATVPRLVLDHLTVLRPGGNVTRSDVGVVLSDDPVHVDLRGGSTPLGRGACYVRLWVQLAASAARVEARGIAIDRGVEQHVATDTASTGRASRGFAVPRGHLPDVGRGVTPELRRDIRFGIRPPKLTPELLPLYRSLLDEDPRRYRNVSAAWLKEEVARRKLAEPPPTADQPKVIVDRSGRHTIVELQLLAVSMDEVRLVGRGAHVLGIQWAAPEDLERAKDWEPVGCFPACSDEPNYRKRNGELMQQRSGLELASELVLGAARPTGAEPLDDPQVPPVRSATDDELTRRYLEPWETQLRPWLDRVLGESLGGTVHQSEVTDTVTMDVLGQDVAGGVSDGAPDEPSTMQLPLYGMLLGASTTFQVARQLGLAAVVKSPDDRAWDYRVRGAWSRQDLLAWPASLERRLQEIAAAAATASAWQRAELETEAVTLAAELAATRPMIARLLALGGGGPVQLAAVALGIRTHTPPLYAGPTELRIADEGRAAPLPGRGDEGVARLSWPLRPRAHGLDDAAVPMGAAVARATSGSPGQRFDAVLNAPSPDTGMPLAVLPPDDPDAPGAAGWTRLRDRRVPANVTLRYGVSEVDPFGRWSPFTEATHHWGFVQPPGIPTVTAELAPHQGVDVLTVRFSWPVADPHLDAMRFLIHLRRDPLPNGSDPHARTHWGRAEAVAGTGAGPVQVRGNGTAAATHDGMDVRVTATDEVGRRGFTVQLAGLQLDRDVVGSARVYVGVATVDQDGVASAEVGGPAMARHVRSVPPPSPSLPAEPLQATFADADGTSSITLRWDGAADTRYVLMRAGERAIVRWHQDQQALRAAEQDGPEVPDAHAALDAALAAYDPDASPADRADALKTLAIAARAAFQPCSEPVPAVAQAGDPPHDPPPEDWPLLPAGPVQVTDRLPGTLRTLSVYVPLGRSRAGTPADWPTSGAAFAVVAVPHVPEPSPPLVLRAAWAEPSSVPTEPAELGMARAELVIARPPAATATPVAYEVYRTTDPTRADDHRRMRPMHGLAVEPDTWETVEVAGEDTDVATWIDPTVEPWRTYHYRVVARAAALDGAGPGTRSGASSPARVDTVAPGPSAPPTALTATRSGDTVTVGFTADAPETVFGGFRIEVVDAVRGITLRRAGAPDVAVDADRFEVVVEVPPPPDPPAVAPTMQVAVRIIDPLGRATRSDEVTVVAE